MAQELEKSLIALIKQDIEKKMIASRVILDGLYDFAEEIAREIDVNEYSNYSCEKGCYYCCNVSVSLFAYELFNIINYIKLNNIDVSADIVGACELFDTKSSQEWGKNARYCPFLHKEQKYCIIHPVRPGTCRAILSRKRDLCINAHNSRGGDGQSVVCISRAQDDAYQHIQLVLASAEASCNLQSGGIELVSAARIALSDEASFEKWLAGENIFAPCRVSVAPREVRV